MPAGHSQFGGKHTNGQRKSKHGPRTGSTRNTYPYHARGSIGSGGATRPKVTGVRSSFSTISGAFNPPSGGRTFYKGFKVGNSRLIGGYSRNSQFVRVGYLGKSRNVKLSKRSFHYGGTTRGGKQILGSVSLKGAAYAGAIGGGLLLASAVKRHNNRVLPRGTSQLEGRHLKRITKRGTIINQANETRGKKATLTLKGSNKTFKAPRYISYSSRVNKKGTGTARVIASRGLRARKAEFRVHGGRVPSRKTLLAAAYRTGGPRNRLASARITRKAGYKKNYVATYARQSATRQRVPVYTPTYSRKARPIRNPKPTRKAFRLRRDSKGRYAGSY